MNRPAVDVVDELKATGEGDILVPSSASVIKALLTANKIDRLGFIVVPEIVGGGPRLFDDGIAPGRWSLATSRISDLGEMSLFYDRVR